MASARIARLLVGALLAAAALGAAVPREAGDQAFSHADSSFQADASHASKPVADAPKRQGWTECQDRVRFGAYGLTVTQRLDPDTGFPPAAREWGDSFVGITGKRPAFYMSSNWSPWDFLAARVRLTGEDKDLPNPALFGRLAFCGLREQTARRVVADAVWRDVRGGFLRARLVGWRGSDRFGLSLRYTPPPGTRVAALAYALVCQPYDYADRGHWERQRWVQTPLRAAPVGRERLVFDPAVESQCVMHNRLAHNTAGCFLAVDHRSVAGVTVHGGQTIQTELTPVNVDGDLVLVLGDWIEEPYARAAAGFFADADAVATELGETAAVRVPLPSVAIADDAAEMDRLLAAHPTLQAAFGDRLAQARSAYAAARTRATTGGPDGEIPAETLAALAEAQSTLETIAREACTAWVRQRLFAEPVRP